MNISHVLSHPQGIDIFKIYSAVQENRKKTAACSPGRDTFWQRGSHCPVYKRPVLWSCWVDLSLDISISVLVVGKSYVRSSCCLREIPSSWDQYLCVGQFQCCEILLESKMTMCLRHWRLVGVAKCPCRAYLTVSLFKIDASVCLLASPPKDITRWFPRSCPKES